MKKARPFVCFLLTLMLALMSCGKDDDPTVVKGRITDRKTGEPIEGASILVGGKKPATHGQDGFFVQPCTNSNASGGFTCIIEGYFTSSQIDKVGYVTKKNGIKGIENGEENNIEINLAPRDGTLKLEIQNMSGQHDTLYAYIYSVTEDIEANGFYAYTAIKQYPLVINQGETYSETFHLASPEMIEIRWGFEQPPYQIKPPFQDSILVATNDTVTYILSY